MNKTCAGPPTRNQVSGASGSLDSKRPRSCERQALRAERMSGKVIASDARANWQGRAYHGNKTRSQSHHPMLRTKYRTDTALRSAAQIVLNDLILERAVDDFANVDRKALA